MLHDPGALGLADRRSTSPVVWRCHLDASHAEDEALERVACLLELTTPDARRGSVLRPARDDRLRPPRPASTRSTPRNLDLEPRLPGRVVRPLGVDLERPFVLQVVQLDRWDDPHSAIEAFRLAKRGGARPPAGARRHCSTRGAAEDWRAAKEVSDYAAGEDDVLLLTTLRGPRQPRGGRAPAAGARGARAVAEGGVRPRPRARRSGSARRSWAAPTAVCASPSATAWTASSPPTRPRCAERLVELVRDPGLAVEMGRAGRERVRERFLVTAALERELRALAAP